MLPGSLPQQLGRYTLCHRLGVGGMATVYLAEHRGDAGFRKWVAVKVVHPHLALDPQFADLFLDEARIAARIDHPNVGTVFDFGTARGVPYFAMEYLHGVSLAQLLRRSEDAGLRLPAPAAARIVADVARGLHAAHELRTDTGAPAHVVHRDVSPQNVFVLFDGLAKIVDFGIARSSDRRAEQTALGEVRGKLAYMAPEQMRQEPIDRRADVFALGIVLWEATTGERLFRRATDVATISAVLDAPVPRPSLVDPDYPPELEAIVLRALARDPAARYPTADALARALEHFVAGSGHAGAPSALVDLMRGLFADDLAARDALLSARDDGPEISLVTPTATTAVASHPTTPTTIAPVADPSPLRVGPRPRLRAVAALAALGLAAGALAVVARARSHADSRAADSTMHAPAASVASSAATPARTDRAALVPAPPAPAPDVRAEGIAQSASASATTAAAAAATAPNPSRSGSGTRTPRGRHRRAPHERLITEF